MPVTSSVIPKSDVCKSGAVSFILQVIPNVVSAHEIEEWLNHMCNIGKELQITCFFIFKIKVCNFYIAPPYS